MYIIIYIHVCTLICNIPLAQAPPCHLLKRSDLQLLGVFGPESNMKKDEKTT